MQGLVEVMDAVHVHRVLHRMDGDDIPKFSSSPNVCEVQNFRLVIGEKSKLVLKMYHIVKTCRVEWSPSMLTLNETQLCSMITCLCNSGYYVTSVCIVGLHYQHIRTVPSVT